MKELVLNASGLRKVFELLKGWVEGRFLPIFRTTEHEFWEKYNDGSIADGLYQYMEDVISFNPFSELEFHERQLHMPAHTYTVYGNQYFIANNHTDPSQASIFVVDKDGSNAQTIRPYLGQNVYAYLGENQGGIAVDDNGFLYCTCRTPGSVVIGINAQNPTDINQHRATPVGSSNYAFKQVTFQSDWDRSLATLMVDDSFAVADGGIFAVPMFGSGAIRYFRNGVGEAQSSVQYGITSSNVCAVDYDTSRLFVVNNNTQMMVFDRNCSLTTHNLPLPSGFTSHSVNRQAVIARNGRVLIDLACTEGTVQTRVILVFNAQTNTWMHTEEITALRTFAIASATQIMAGRMDVDNAVIYRVWTGNRNAFIKWDYTTNAISTFVSVSATASGNTLPILLNDGNEIFNSFSQGANSVINVINPTTMTAHSYTLPLNTMGRDVALIKEDGVIYILSYMLGAPGAFTTIDANGNVSTTTVSGSGHGLPQRMLLDKTENKFVMIPTGQNGTTNLVYDSEINVISYVNVQGLRAFIKTDEQGFIYSTQTGLVEKGRSLRKTSKLVSWGEIL